MLRRRILEVTESHRERWTARGVWDARSSTHAAAGSRSALKDPRTYGFVAFTFAWHVGVLEENSRRNGKLEREAG